jgi:hypothetical protein
LTLAYFGLDPFSVLFLSRKTLHALPLSIWVHTINHENSSAEPKSRFIFSHLRFFPEPNEPKEPKRASYVAHFATFSEPFAPPLHPLDE